MLVLCAMRLLVAISATFSLLACLLMGRCLHCPASSGCLDWVSNHPTGWILLILPKDSLEWVRESLRVGKEWVKVEKILSSEKILKKKGG